MSNPYQPPESPFGMQPGYDQPQGGDGLAIAALVCGILSIALALCCALISLPLSIASVVMGSMSMKSQQRGMATAGLICGIIGLLLTLGMMAIGIAVNFSDLQSK